MANRQHDQIQWIPTGDPATVDMKVNPYPGALGGLYTDDQGKQWQLVQGDSSMSVAPFPGATLWWGDKANFKVTTSPTGITGHTAGIMARVDRLGADLASGIWGAGNFFFIQKGGRGIAKLVDAPTSAPTGAGAFVVPSTTAGKANTLAAGTAATYPPIGREAGWYNIAAREVYVDLSILESED